MSGGTGTSVSWLPAPRDVIIPFTEELADRVIAVAVRKRRDFAGLLTLIRAHALLHSASRTRDDAGAIVATVEDYAAVRALVADVLAEGVSSSSVSMPTTSLPRKVAVTASVKQQGEPSQFRLIKAGTMWEKTARSSRSSKAIMMPPIARLALALKNTESPGMPSRTSSKYAGVPDEY